jgi:hypothetical protein
VWAGQPHLILNVTHTNPIEIGGGLRHSWQSFGFVGGEVRALPCVPLTLYFVKGKLKIRP